MLYWYYHFLEWWTHFRWASTITFVAIVFLMGSWLTYAARHATRVKDNDGRCLICGRLRKDCTAHDPANT